MSVIPGSMHISGVRLALCLLLMVAVCLQVSSCSSGTTDARKAGPYRISSILTDWSGEGSAHFFAYNPDGTVNTIRTINRGDTGRGELKKFVYHDRSIIVRSYPSGLVIPKTTDSLVLDGHRRIIDYYSHDGVDIYRAYKRYTYNDSGQIVLCAHHVDNHWMVDTFQWHNGDVLRYATQPEPDWVPHTRIGSVVLTYYDSLTDGRPDIFAISDMLTYGRQVYTSRHLLHSIINLSDRLSTDISYQFDSLHRITRVREEYGKEVRTCDFTYE